jgi:hypothetical protein
MVGHLKAFGLQFKLNPNRSGWLRFETFEQIRLLDACYALLLEPKLAALE